MLREAGYVVDIFEKSRHVGGRMATRESSTRLAFDHGARYFTVRDAGFSTYVAEWQKAGVVQEWRGKIAVIDGQGREVKASAERSESSTSRA